MEITGLLFYINYLYGSMYGIVPDERSNIRLN